MKKNQSLSRAGFTDILDYEENKVLFDLIENLNVKLMLAQIAVGLGKINIPNFDVRNGNGYIKEAMSIIRDGKAGYGMIIAKA